MNKVKDKFSQEMADIKRFLQEKDRELTLARSIAKERDIAALALSEELVEHRREFREKERKLKEQLIEEAKRAEKQLTREKKVAFTKAEEIANTQKQKELLELKEKLIEEKHAALSGAKQKHSTQAKELEQKLQVNPTYVYAHIRIYVRTYVWLWIHTATTYLLNFTICILCLAC